MTEAHRRNTLEEAKIAALDLAKHRGCSVYVMQCVGVAVAETLVEWSETKET
jgi:hypothetical protein